MYFSFLNNVLLLSKINNISLFKIASSLAISIKFLANKKEYNNLNLIFIDFIHSLLSLNNTFIKLKPLKISKDVNIKLIKNFSNKVNFKWTDFQSWLLFFKFNKSFILFIKFNNLNLNYNQPKTFIQADLVNNLRYSWKIYDLFLEDIHFSISINNINIEKKLEKYMLSNINKENLMRMNYMPVRLIDVT